MSAIIYPSSPTDGQEFTDDNGVVWVWKAVAPSGKWGKKPSTGGGGSGAWDDITGKPAAITGTTASFTTAQESKLAGIATGATAAGATGDAYATSHESDTTAHPASSIVNTPAGNIAATTVQGALNELDNNLLNSKGVRSFINETALLASTPNFKGQFAFAISEGIYYTAYDTTIGAWIGSFSIDAIAANQITGSFTGNGANLNSIPSSAITGTAATLSGNQSFTGALTISGGGSVVVNSGATFQHNAGATVTIGNPDDWKTAIKASFQWERKTSDFLAVVGGRYICAAPVMGSITITPPTDPPIGSIFEYIVENGPVNGLSSSPLTVITRYLGSGFWSNVTTTSGSTIPNLNASNLTTGTVSLSRLVNTQTVGNADATITALVRDVLLTSTLSAPRTYTWPLASAYPAGARVSFADMANTLTASNTATLTRSGSDTINGATSIAMNTAGASPILISDGVSKWNIDIRGISRGGTGATTAAGAWTNLGGSGTISSPTFTTVTASGGGTFSGPTNMTSGNFYIGTTADPGMRFFSTLSTHRSNHTIAWTSGSANLSEDTGISRTAAGNLAIGNGTQGSTAGSLSLTNLTASGKVTEGVYTVATTPTHSLGAQIRINNATGATIGGVVAGTGSQHVVARSNGTQWICISIIIP